MLDKIGEGSGPPSVTVRAVTGLPAEELVTHHADCPVVVITDDNT